jgi:hypothetical protein
MMDDGTLEENHVNSEGRVSIIDHIALWVPLLVTVIAYDATAQENPNTPPTGEASTLVRVTDGMPSIWKPTLAESDNQLPRRA